MKALLTARCIYGAESDQAEWKPLEWGTCSMMKSKKVSYINHFTLGKCKGSNKALEMLIHNHKVQSFVVI